MVKKIKENKIIMSLLLKRGKKLKAKYGRILVSTAYQFLSECVFSQLP